jgi:two-component system, LuxR family, sensor kinase FixL
MNKINRHHQMESIKENCKGEILVVDDNPDNIKLLTGLLVDQEYKVRVAVDGKQALKSVAMQEPELILLDIKLPEMDGYDVCRQLKADEHTRDIPILFISGLEMPEDRIKGFDVGGVDYITKPFEKDEVLARVRTHLELHSMQLHLEQLIRTRTAELEQSNEKLLISERRYRTLIDQASDAIFLIDPQGNILEANVAACSMQGYSQDELQILNLTDISMTALDIMQAELQEIFITKHAFFESTHRRKDGTIFPVEVSLGTVELEGNEMILAMVRDITERKQAEESLRKAEAETQQHRDQLAHMSRVHTMGELATSMAHEINQPLAAIDSYAQAGLLRIKAGTAGPEKLSELLTNINVQAVLCSNIVEHIRNMVKKHKVKMVSANINQLLKDIVVLAEMDTELRNCELHLELQDILPSIKVDIVQIQQVALNLIRNAIDAVCELDHPEKRVITISSCHKEPNEVHISVTDQGSGIVAEDVDRIFEPFHSSKESGMGIGLPLCRSIIEAHKGSIGYTPNPEGGAIFTFKLPIVAEEA